jgi:hypothetical protein
MIGAKRKGRFETAPKTKRVVGQEVSLPWEISEKIIGYAVHEFAMRPKPHTDGGNLTGDFMLYVDRDLCYCFLRLFAMFQNSVMHNKHMFYYTRALIWRTVYEYHQVSFVNADLHIVGLLPAGFVHEISVTPCFSQRVSLVGFAGKLPCDAARLLCLPRVDYLLCNDVRQFLDVIGQLPEFAVDLALVHVHFTRPGRACRYMTPDERRYWTPARFYQKFPHFNTTRITVVPHDDGMYIHELWDNYPDMAFVTYHKVRQRLDEFLTEGLSLEDWRPFNEYHQKFPEDPWNDRCPGFGEIATNMDFMIWLTQYNPTLATAVHLKWDEFIGDNGWHSSDEGSGSEEW